MLGQVTIGTYIMYGGLVLIILVVLVLFVRMAMMFPLLLLSPAAAIAKRLKRLFRFGAPAD